MIRSMILAAALAATAAPTAVAQRPLPGQTVAPAYPGAAASLPFAPGERLTYDVHFGPLRVGTAEMSLQQGTVIGGEPTWHATFRVRGGVPGFRIDDRLESWFEPDALASRRFVRDLREGPKHRVKTFEIDPVGRTFTENGGAAQPTVAQPLDEASLLYVVRTLELTPGRTIALDRYFRPDRNPVTIKVLRREKVKVPAGTFDAIVVQPIIRTSGIFGEDGRAEVWFSDDAARRVLRLRAKVAFGNIDLKLRR